MEILPIFWHFSRSPGRRPPRPEWGGRTPAGRARRPSRTCRTGRCSRTSWLVRHRPVNPTPNDPTIPAQASDGRMTPTIPRKPLLMPRRTRRTPAWRRDLPREPLLRTFCSINTWPSWRDLVGSFSSCSQLACPALTFVLETELVHSVRKDLRNLEKRIKLIRISTGSES